MAANFNPERSLELAAAATPGPWVASDWTVTPAGDLKVFSPEYEVSVIGTLPLLNEDARHIADARTSLPEACRRLVRLRELWLLGIDDKWTIAEESEFVELLTWEATDG